MRGVAVEARGVAGSADDGDDCCTIPDTAVLATAGPAAADGAAPGHSNRRGDCDDCDADGRRRELADDICACDCAADRGVRNFECVTPKPNPPASTHAGAVRGVDCTGSARADLGRAEAFEQLDPRFAGSRDVGAPGLLVSEPRLAPCGLGEVVVSDRPADRS